MANAFAEDGLGRDTAKASGMWPHSLGVPSCWGLPSCGWGVEKLPRRGETLLTSTSLNQHV